MRRYVCPMPSDDMVAGAFVLIDLLAVKPNREPLSIYGAQYGGPNFNEASPAAQTLHVEEYFYVGTGADLVTNPVLGEGHYLAQEVPFDKAALGSKAKWCIHVDIDVTNQGGAEAAQEEADGNSPSSSSSSGEDNLVVLRPACGIGSYRPQTAWAPSVATRREGALCARWPRHCARPLDASALPQEATLPIRAHPAADFRWRRARVRARTVTCAEPHCDAACGDGFVLSNAWPPAIGILTSPVRLRQPLRGCHTELGRRPARRAESCPHGG